MAGVQQFGTMDLVGGLRDVMFCADDDRPTEGLLTWAGDDLLSAGGVAVQITARDGFLSLKPALLYKINSVGGLYAPQWAELSTIQQEMLLARIELKSSATGTAGQWSTELGRPENSILFAPIDPPRTLPSDTCSSWNEFKAWASQVRTDHDAVSFRGHGNMGIQTADNFAPNGQVQAG